MAVQPTVRVLLIANDPNDADVVKQALESDKYLRFELCCVNGLLPGLDLLARGNIDLVLLDQSVPDGHGLAGVHAIRRHAQSTPVVVLGNVDSEADALQAVQSGAQDYVSKSALQGPLLVRVVQQAILRQRVQGESIPESRQTVATVLGVVGAKGGVGSTIIASHLALELNRQSGAPVLLMDLDMAGQAVGFLMGITARYGVNDASGDLLHLDEERWTKLIARRPGGLDIMQSGGPAILDEQRPRVECVSLVLRFVKATYRWIVLDLGRLSTFAVRIAEELDQLYLVSTCDVLSLSEAKAAAHALRGGSLDRERLCVILNQAPARPLIPRQQVEKLLEAPVKAMLPECREEFEHAFEDGQLLGEGSTFRNHVSEFAAAIAGGGKEVRTAKKPEPYVMRLFRSSRGSRGA